MCNVTVWKEASPKCKGILFESYVMPAILYASEVYCLRECKMRILRKTERFTVRAMCRGHLKDNRRVMDLVLMLSLIGCAKQGALVWGCHEEVISV